jgi:hypothetical protein
VNYENSKNKVKIICKEHGIFEKNPNNHLSGQGCTKCSLSKRTNIRRKTLQDFIKQANFIHNNFYDYSLVNYKNTEEKVKIICPLHGEFEQKPGNHLNNRGCRKCGYLRVSEIQGKLNNGWNYSLWERKGKESKNFDSFKLYIIRCFNDTEEFYKIGKTFNKLKRRFSCKKVLPYNYEIIEIIEKSAKQISILERTLHKIHHKHSYIPKIYFEGNKECFSKLELDLLRETIKKI